MLLRGIVRYALGGLLGIVALGAPSFAQPARVFGPDSKSTGVFTGAGTVTPGLHCSTPVSSPFAKCSGFLASDLDGTLLDVTVTVPPGAAPHPLVVYVHGYGGSKSSSSSYDDAFASRGFTVLRYSTRGFGESWGQVNLSDIDVELSDLRSLVGQVVDDPQLLADRSAVAIVGASYGGGHSWMAAVKPTFDSTPGKGPVRIRTVVPIAAWSDLLASLRPNGDSEDSVEPPGFYKLSFFEGLFLGGLRRSPSRPYPNYPGYLWLWNAYALAFEPNNAPPVGSGLVNGIAGYRSIWWQQQFWKAVHDKAGTADQLPIFIVQGFTDDLFPLTEALRMYDALRSIDGNYPIAAYFGDLGHPRAANKPLEMSYALDRVLEWLDFYLLGKGVAAEPPKCGPARQLRCDVLAAITRPGTAFNEKDVIQVAHYADLKTGDGHASFSGEAILTFNPANVAGLFVDPFVFSGCDALVSPACTAPIPALVPGDVAVYTVRASELSDSAGLTPGPFLIAGQPLVAFSATSLAPRIQLNARLYDVTADGSRQLITRGTFTLDSRTPLGPIGTREVVLTTYGNLWEVAPDHLVQLELTNVDSPYLTPSRIPSITVIRDVNLAVPVRPVP